MKRVLIYILIFTSNAVYTQDKHIIEELLQAEKQILKNFESLYESSDARHIDSINEVITKDIMNYLSTWDGFHYKWDALDMIGRVESEDGRVKLFTWFAKYDENNYRYHGVLSYRINEKSKDPDNFKAVELNDNSADIKNPETRTLGPESWYGAVYYRLKAFTHRRDTWYALIGFDFNDPFSNKKIIEILSIDRKGEIKFGGEVMTEEGEKNRMIFEYSSEVAMAVNYDEKLDMFVYDHLRPYQPIFEGNYRFYAPDGSYDGLRFEKGVFIKEEDIDARNY
jgi:hypothetical protein